MSAALLAMIEEKEREIARLTTDLHDRDKKLAAARGSMLALANLIAGCLAQKNQPGGLDGQSGVWAGIVRNLRSEEEGWQIDSAWKYVNDWSLRHMKAADAEVMGLTAEIARLREALQRISSTTDMLMLASAEETPFISDQFRVVGSMARAALAPQEATDPQQ